VHVTVRCKLVQLACERPLQSGTPAPFREVWTYGALAEAVEQSTGCRLSVSEVGRILRFEEIRPHRVRQWLKCSDPAFLEKAERVCDLYLHPPRGEVVLCIDEKPMQVIERCHPMHVDIKDGSLRSEYEYRRHGTQSLLAAFDTETGRVFGRVVAHRSGAALVSFMEEMARRYPGKTVHVVWDNLNIHFDGTEARWSEFNKRHGGRFRFVHTPKHASWMNQIEIWFSILQRRVLKHGSFTSRLEQARRVRGYIKHWNRWERHPFRWTWRSDKPQDERRSAA
jgi:transposase